MPGTLPDKRMWGSADVSAAFEQTSDDDFVRALYDAHVERVRNVLARMLGPGVHVDDLTQDVFEVALRKRRRVEAPGVQPGGWLCAVAVKMAYARRRQLRVRRFLGLETVEQVPASEDPSQPLAREDARRWVYEALERLAERKRTVFVLYELEGMSGEQIAALLDVPLKTVWSRLAHARSEFEAAIQRMSARRGEAP